MPVAITENFESREFTVGTSPDRELRYDVVGTDDELEVESLLLATSPETYQGLVRDSVNAAPNGGPFVWRGTVRYRGAEWNAVEHPEYPATLADFSFDTGGGTSRLRQSAAGLIYDAPGKVAPDFFGAINVSDGKVEGVDVVTPKYEFSETHEFADATVTQAFKMTIFNTTGTVNGNIFRGFAAGEVLFLGATGARPTGETWRITYRFACSPNVADLTIGPIAGIAKLGWEYLWCYYEEVEDTAAYSLVTRPIGAYVEQVYPIRNFSVLGIGA